MDNFEYRNGRLHCEEVALNRIAEQYGTPLYVYSRDAIERAYMGYAQALEGHEGMVCYAVKANSNLGTEHPGTPGRWFRYRVHRRVGTCTERRW